MKKIISFLIALFFLSCKNNTLKFYEEFNSARYSLQVIDNLDSYDSLRQIILKEITSFELTPSEFSITYIYHPGENTLKKEHSHTTLPLFLSSVVIPLFEKIGKDRIFGFTISKDSSFDILISNSHLPDLYLDVRERLHWKKKSSDFKPLDFPEKDTALTPNWHYSIWFDKRSE